MFNINHNKKAKTLEIECADYKFFAKIHIDAGASLQELTLAGHEIIKPLSPLPYTTTYASSILFPFANRIKDGHYKFQGEEFEFEINQKEENNALHGLVYDKTFDVLNIETEPETALILLEYNETELSKGFPYKYRVQLEYRFTKDKLDLKMSVKNNDAKPFPFTLGWHPYFLSHNLYESSLEFSSNKKLELDDRNITVNTLETETKAPLKIGKQQFDDCWVLNNDEILFKTPKYTLKFNATGNNNFLQVYTPPKENTIAIEPTTGVSDSFNNEIGLAILEAGNSYEITWSLNIESNQT